jgi:hypothetical protein
MEANLSQRLAAFEANVKTSIAEDRDKLLK